MQLRPGFEDRRLENGSLLAASGGLPGIGVEILDEVALHRRLPVGQEPLEVDEPEVQRGGIFHCVKGSPFFGHGLPFAGHAVVAGETGEQRVGEIRAEQGVVMEADRLVERELRGRDIDPAHVGEIAVRGARVERRQPGALFLPELGLGLLYIGLRGLDIEVVIEKSALRLRKRERAGVEPGGRKRQNAVPDPKFHRSRSLKMPPARHVDDGVGPRAQPFRL